ncbi:MAG: chorismate synthase, partial [Spirochaetales bacterium]|nr:chorismate synthase [Spirochaetales bacterium]
DKNGFKTNNAGGIIGGITTGEDIIFRIAVKPTSSISRKQTTVNIDGKEQSIKTEGRHDPCICPRIIPVVEAMTALVLVDMYKREAALLS